ncbi:MAG: ABC transporter substrate-binding protein, partial [Rubrivivax sp.]
ALVLHLTSAAEQKQRALRGSFNPTRPDLYVDAQILQANPFMGELAQTFADAVARPTAMTGTRYNQLSHRFWNAAHDVVSGRSPPEQALHTLDRQLQRLSRGGRWP